jgi:ribosome biogenesis protein BMS1
VNPHEDARHRKTDLMQLIYDSKEPLRARDNSKFTPEGTYSESLQNLFVTGMEDDVLNERQEETEQQKQERELEKIMKSKVTRAKIGEQTNFYRKGLYVKVTLEALPFEAFRNMKAALPVILARVNLGEDSRGFIKTRFKRHRWYNNLLRSTDPLIVSSGWRRYQTVPAFATEDENERLRYLKYTPQHDFCLSVFYGNFSLQNSGCLFLQTLRNDLRKFRIAGSGVVLEMNKSFEVLSLRRR